MGCKHFLANNLVHQDYFQGNIGTPENCQLVWRHSSMNAPLIPGYVAGHRSSIASARQQRVSAKWVNLVFMSMQSAPSHCFFGRSLFRFPWKCPYVRRYSRIALDIQLVSLRVYCWLMSNETLCFSSWIEPFLTFEHKNVKCSYIFIKYNFNIDSVQPISCEAKTCRTYKRRHFSST